MGHEATRVLRGRQELLRLLAESTHDVRGLDADGFRAWLAPHLERWNRDPVFQQLTRIREIRRAQPRLAELERRLREVRAELERAPAFDRIQANSRQLRGAQQAVQGLERARAAAGPPDRPALQRKLDAFRARVAALREEERQLIDATPAKRELHRLQEELALARREVGLDREEARLAELQHERGRSSGRSGRGFEDSAARAVARYVVPELAQEVGCEPGTMRVLRGVTLGAARTEIDQLVVRPLDRGRTTEVLALVEAKRNINDLAHGFRQRLENLAWITGDQRGHDPEAYRTGRFPAGRFSRAVVHEQDGARFLLAAESFARFHHPGGTGPDPSRIVLVTRRGSLWGMSAAALARLAHRIATDEEWDLLSEGYLSALLEWCRSLTHPVEAPDVLRTFAASEALARRVLLL